MTRPPMKFIDASAAPFETLEQWRLAPRDGAFVSVPNDFDVESLEAELPRLAGIALQFPKWVDGRAYSQARLLRERYNYRGELRATGQVLRDQFVFMLRAGFDSFEVKKEADAEAFAATVKRYSVFYQATGDGRITALHRRMQLRHSEGVGT